MVDLPSVDTPFNMAMLYYMEFQRLMQIKHRAMLDDDLNLAYECLEEMFTMVSFKLTKKEDQTMTKQIESLRKKVPTVPLPNNIMQKIRQDFKDIMRSVDRSLLKYMDKYKMIFPRIEIRGGIKKYREKMGLDGNNNK